MIRLFALLLALTPLVAETNLERGKRVIGEALAAVGGDQFLQMQDRVEEGRAYTFYREHLSGLGRAKISTRYLVRPEPPVPGQVEVRERQAFGGKAGDNAVLFVDGQGYEITFRGARILTDEVLERYKETTLRNVFYILRQRMGEPELTFTSRGASVLLELERDGEEGADPLEVEMPRAQFEQLEPQAGERFVVRPRSLRVFPAVHP